MMNDRQIRTARQSFWALKLAQETALEKALAKGDWFRQTYPEKYGSY